MATEISGYDRAWPARAEAARYEIEEAAPGLLTTIEHIGSTAVPGLAAKPVIDLMAATPSLDAVIEAEHHLAEIGFHRAETGMSNRLFYLRNGADGRRTHHLHVVTGDSWSTRNERLLRDYLRAHPDDRDRYASLKRRLRDLDGDAYTRAKTALIQELVDRARSERGLPTVSVWEG
jgi:GrpB-like predicted nucleotidyltransferase (UPF0157 family)